MKKLFGFGDKKKATDENDTPSSQSQSRKSSFFKKKKDDDEDEVIDDDEEAYNYGEMSPEHDDNLAKPAQPSLFKRISEQNKGPTSPIIKENMQTIKFPTH